MLRWIHGHTGRFIAASVVTLSLIVVGVTIALINHGDQRWTPDRYISYVRDGNAFTTDQVSDDAIANTGATICDQLDAGVGAKRLADMASRGLMLPNGGYVGLSDETMGNAPLQLEPRTADRLVAGAVRTYCRGHEGELSKLPDA